MKTLLSTDVLVVGGGPAGIGAAIGAAKQGADTLLIENHGFFGGVASFAIGMCINNMRPFGKPRSDVHELLIDKLENYGPIAYAIRDEGILRHSLFTNVEYLKVAALDALDSVGCKYHVHMKAVDTQVEDDRVTGVVVSTKRGLMTIRAKTVVDCSGDADVAYYAGAETMMDPTNSPMTLCFNVTNIDMEKASQFGHRSEVMKEIAAKAREAYPLIPDDWGLTPYVSSTCLNVNHAGTRVLGPMDATDPDQLTTVECTSRRQVLQMIQAMREYGPEELREIEIVSAGPQIGIRESRRVKGEYVLTEDDAFNGARFDDAVAWRTGMLDIGFVRTEPMPTFDIPYRCLLPEKLDGLLVAGRCMSTTHTAASAGKSMGNQMAAGHAAGIAAALSAEKNVQPRELAVSGLQDAIRAQAVDLDHEDITMEFSKGAERSWRSDEDWK